MLGRDLQPGLGLISNYVSKLQLAPGMSGCIWLLEFPLKPAGSPGYEQHQLIPTTGRGGCMPSGCKPLRRGGAVLWDMGSKQPPADAAEIVGSGQWFQMGKGATV